MSVEAVRAEIAKFVAGSGGSVLSVRGPWGVGKTWAWEDITGEEALSKTVQLKRYSYVSLFGINSLEELKSAIFEASVGIDGKFPSPNEQTFAELVDGMINSKGRGLWKYLEIFPGLKGAGATIAGLSFLSVRNMIICFDDLERKGKGLELTDVLGLASMLKERRGCRVALLLNDENFQAEQEKGVFELYLEKVTDQSLHFDPTSAEAVSIATSGIDPISKRTSELCTRLGIRNIRIMKRAERWIRQLETLLVDYDQRVLEVASSSLVLFVWSHYDRKAAPTINFIKSYNQFSARPGDDPNSSKNASWGALLGDYGYSSTDDFDLELINAVERGYFDVTALRGHAEKAQRELLDQDADQLFGDAWRKFHDDFNVPAAEVVAAIEDAFKKGYYRISPTNLNGTVKLFKELGYDDVAKELIELYVSQDKPREFFLLEEYPFRENVTDPDIISAFAARASAIEEERDYVELLKELNDGWNNKTIDALAALPVDQYVDIFSRLKGRELRTVLSGALSFDRVGNADDRMREIPRRTREALALIGRRSEINALRVAKYGVEIEAIDE